MEGFSSRENLHHIIDDPFSKHQLSLKCENEYNFAKPYRSGMYLFVTCAIYSQEGKRLSCAKRTKYGGHKDNVWNELLTIPIKYSALPLNSQVVFTVWDILTPGFLIFQIKVTNFSYF